MLRLRRLPLFCLLFHALFLSEAMRRNCGRGTFCNGEDCELCPRGTYQNATRSASCAPCPIGTYNPFRGAQGIDVCIPCVEGTLSNATGPQTKRACKACPPSPKAPSGSPSCIFCAAGKYLSPCKQTAAEFGVIDEGMCKQCYFATTGICCRFTGPITLRGYNCPRDMFANKPNSFTCSYCEGQRTAQRRMTCADCPPGTGPSGGRCLKCKNAVSDGSRRGCVRCPPGRTPNKWKEGRNASLALWALSSQAVLMKATPVVLARVEKTPLSPEPLTACLIRPPALPICFVVQLGHAFDVWFTRGWTSAGRLVLPVHENNWAWEACRLCVNRAP